jgi:hypothetical protein
MTQDEEVRLLDVAAELVLGPLAAEPIEIINRTGRAMAAISEAEFRGLSDACLSGLEFALERINAVGELLGSLRERDRVAIARGERWKRGSRALSPEEGKKALRGMTLDQLDAFATRLGYGRDEVISGAMGYSEIHGGVLWALGDRDEMAKITGGER